MKNKEVVQNKKVIYREELIDSISKISGLSRFDSSQALKGMLESIQKTLKEKRKIRITGFGTFQIKQHPAIMARNIRTGENLIIPASQYPIFRTGKILKGWEGH